MIKHPDHVTIVVTDIAAAKKFFSLLNFKEKLDVVISGKKFANYMHIDPIEAEHVTLVLENSFPRFEIQLLNYHQPSAIPDPHIKQLNKVGYNHLCLAVDNIDKVVKHLKKNDVKFVNEIIQFHDRKLIYFSGPDGITLELAEWIEK